MYHQGYLSPVIRDSALINKTKSIVQKRSIRKFHIFSQGSTMELIHEENSKNIGYKASLDTSTEQKGSM